MDWKANTAPVTAWLQVDRATVFPNPILKDKYDLTDQTLTDTWRCVDESDS